MICFTAILGGFEQLRPVTNPGDARWIALTDHPPVDPMGWEMWPVPPAQNPADPRRMARRYKVLCHRFFPDADAWLWLDGAIQLTVPPETVANALLDGADIGGFRHPGRNCAYAEADRCIQKGKDTARILNGQKAAMKAAGFPEGWGLVETGLLARRNTKEIRNLNERWWLQIEQYSMRDQISLPFSCWRLGVSLFGAPGSLVNHHWVDYRSHAGKK